MRLETKEEDARGPSFWQDHEHFGCADCTGDAAFLCGQRCDRSSDFAAGEHMDITLGTSENHMMHAISVYMSSTK